MNILQCLHRTGKISFPHSVSYLTPVGPVNTLVPDRFLSADLVGWYGLDTRNYIDGFDKPLQHNYEFANVEYDGLRYSGQFYSLPRFLRTGSLKTTDSLFVPANQRIVVTPSAQILLDNRRLLLTKELARRYSESAGKWKDFADRADQNNCTLEWIMNLEDEYRISKETTLLETAQELSRRHARWRNYLEPKFSRLSDDLLYRYNNLFGQALEVDPRFHIRKRQGFDHWYTYWAYRCIFTEQQILLGLEPDFPSMSRSLTKVVMGEEIESLEQIRSDNYTIRSNIASKVDETKLRKVLKKCLTIERRSG